MECSVLVVWWMKTQVIPTGCEEGNHIATDAYTFTTNSSELVEVINLYVGGAHQGHYISTDCGNGFEGIDVD